MPGKRRRGGDREKEATEIAIELSGISKLEGKRRERTTLTMMAREEKIGAWWGQK